MKLFCACLTATLVHGPKAARYAQEHLVRATVTDERPAAEPLRGRTFRCPDTKLSWLAVPDGRSAAVLLRGAAPELPVTPAPDPPGLYL